MRKTPTVVLILIVLIFLIPSFIPIFGFAQRTNSPSALVVGEGETVVISGPEYSLKGDIRIKEDGVLNIRDTDFEILQNRPNQFQIELDNSAELILENSSMRSEKDIELDLNRESNIEILDSTLEIPGKISGPADSIKIKDSQVRVNKANVESRTFNVEESSIEGERWLISSSEFTSERSIFHTKVTFHSNTLARFYGSLFKEIETNQDAKAEIYGKVSITVRDKIGVPVDNVRLSIERAGTDYSVDVETGKDGVWSDYLLSEVIGPEDSLFHGNYEIRCSNNGEEIEKMITLPPVEKRGAKNDIEEFGKNLEFEFSEVVSRFAYYNSTDSDFYLGGTRTRTIETYPNQGIDSFIQQGNVLLEESGNLVLEKNSRMKVLQKDENYRVELKGASKLELKENSSIRSDRSLNFYLYDNSTISIDGGVLNAGSIVMKDSSSIETDGGRMEVESLHFDGNRFKMTDSLLRSEIVSVTSQRIVLEDTKLETKDLVNLDGESFTIKRLESEKAIKFSSGKEDITVTDLKAPNLIPKDGLTINREWYVNVKIYNGDDRLVPSVDLQVLRNGPVEKTPVEDIFVREGRAQIPVKSEIITSEGSQFVGNYILEADKSINDERVESEKTMVAVDENLKTNVKFDQHLPYSIDIETENPSDLKPGESFTIEGRAVYDGVDLQVKNATIEIVIAGKDKFSWNTTTDEMGRFELKGEAPSSMGGHTINIRVKDKNLMMDSEKTVSMEVNESDKFSIVHFLFRTTIGRFLTVLLIFGLTILAYKVSTTPMEKQGPAISESNDVVRWSERISKEE